MHASALLLSLAASTTFASVLPRAANNGAWNVTVTYSSAANGFHRELVDAQFVSDSYPDGLFSSCKKEHTPGTAQTPSQDTDGCDPASFSYEYASNTIKVQQNIEEPTKQTVFGEAPLELKIADSIGRTWRGWAIVEVTSAIA